MGVPVCVVCMVFVYICKLFLTASCLMSRFFTLKSKLQRLIASLSSFSLRFRFCGDMNIQDVSLFNMHVFIDLTLD